MGTDIKLQLFLVSFPTPPRRFYMVTSNVERFPELALPARVHVNLWLLPPSFFSCSVSIGYLSLTGTEVAELELWARGVRIPLRLHSLARLFIVCGFSSRFAAFSQSVE